MHYSQMFFVVGHVALKLLTFVEQLENEIKNQGNQMNSGSNGQKNNNKDKPKRKLGNKDKKKRENKDRKRQN